MLCKTFGRLKAPPGLSLLTQTRTQLLLFSDPPRRWFYFDYDPGPFSCVHLQVFIFIFIIAPQKNGVNPKPWIYRNFILPSHNFCRTASIKRFPLNLPEQSGGIKKMFFAQSKTPFSALRHTEKGVLFGYCLGVRRNHVTWVSGCGPASHGKSITAFTIEFVKKL